MSANSVSQLPPPVASRVTVSRLAGNVVRRNECKAMVDAMAADIEALKRTHLTAVVGEEQLLQSLRRQLGEADAQIAELANAPGGSARVRLNRLEATLSGPVWSLAQSTATELAARRAQIDEQTRLIEEEYSSMRLNFDRLAQLARKATAVRLEDAEEQQTLAAEVEGKFRASDLELRMGHFDKVAISVRHAKALLLDLGLATGPDESGVITVNAQALDAYTSAFAEKIKGAEVRDDKMARRSELFVISGGGTELSVPYKVLLRAPGTGTSRRPTCMTTSRCSSWTRTSSATRSTASPRTRWSESVRLRASFRRPWPACAEPSPLVPPPAPSCSTSSTPSRASSRSGVGCTAFSSPTPCSD